MSEKILIIGGVAGGASTAARLRRLNERAKILLFERGNDISFANCGLPYYIGNTIETRENLLVMTAQTFEKRYHVDVRVNNEVVAINTQEKTVVVANLVTQERYEESYDTLIIATGSAPSKPALKGIDGDNIFVLWNMEDTDRMKQYIQTSSPKSAVVVGGGFIGLEMAENLRHLGMDVALVEMQTQVMTQVDEDIAAVLHKELEKQGVLLHLCESIQQFERSAAKKTVVLKSGKKLDCDMVVLCMGVKPNSEIAQKAGIKTNQKGGICTDAEFRTSQKDIYAVGDVIEVQHYIDHQKTMIPLAGPANKQGRMCADNICSANKQYRGTQGSFVAKVFDLSVASTGMNRAQLEQAGLVFGEDFFAVKTHAWSHATYYPGAELFALKLLYSKQGKLLGAQAVGKKGVDKRMDIIATAISMHGTVFDLAQLELCYAPPYASAKDPVNMVGFMAENQLDGRVDFLHSHQFEALDQGGLFLLDVREQSEVDRGAVRGAICIPLGQLRQRMGELARHKKIIVFCAVGMRAYVASCILRQNGFEDVWVYAGGYATYSLMKERGEHA